MDEYISIRVSGLQSGQHVTLRCETVEGKFVFDSYAHFVASIDGEVDLTKHPSFGGSYKGIDQMGIFANMLPALYQKDGLRYFPRSFEKPIPFKLQVCIHFYRPTVPVLNLRNEIHWKSPTNTSILYAVSPKVLSWGIFKHFH